MTITDEDLAEWRKVAKAATPGAWKKTVMEGRWAVRTVYMDKGLRITRWPATCNMATGAEQDADHIATFDPPTVLRLLDELSQLRAQGPMEEPDNGETEG